MARGASVRTDESGGGSDRGGTCHRLSRPRQRSLQNRRVEEAARARSVVMPRIQSIIFGLASRTSTHMTNLDGRTRHRSGAQPRKYGPQFLEARSCEVSPVASSCVREGGQAVSGDAVHAPDEAFSTVAQSADPESDGRAA